jgi:hypothetical protein
MRILMLLLCSAVGCAATSDVDLAATGTWGGPDLSITMTTGGAIAQFVCAHGVIPERIAPDASGNFSATGTYDFERTALVVGQPASESHSARYDGQISGNTMRLSVMVLDTKQVVGPFSATLATAGPSSRCQ